MTSAESIPTIRVNHLSEQELEKRLDRAFQISEEAVCAGVSPGAVLAVGNATSAVFRCHGVTTTLFGGALVTADTLYDMASISKIFTTFLILKLLEEGYLRLDDPVALFLPEYIREDKRDITIRHLLTHTSGLKAHDDYYKVVRSSAEMRRAITEDALNAAIGSVVCYSCLGYISLAGVIEKITGMTLDACLRDYLFKPLQMVSTGYNPQFPKERIAPTEDCPWRGHTAWGEVHDENAFAQGGVSGNAGIFSSAREMIHFAQMWLNYGTFRQQRLLSPTTVEASIQCQTDALGGERRGLGWIMKGHTLSFMGDLAPLSAFGHTGFTGTSLVFNPKQGTFALWLTNRVHPTRNESRHIRYRALLHNTIWAALESH